MKTILQVGLAAGLVLGAEVGTLTEKVAAAAETEPQQVVKPRVLLDNVRAVTLKRSTVFDSPRAASAVENEELRARPPRSVGEALRDEEGVFIQTPSYGFASPNLRGLGEGRVQVLIDGIRLNTTITSTLPGGITNLNLVDPYTVHSIEVVRGPGLAPFGEGGLGGTVYLRTLRPAPIAGSQIELTGGIRAIYSSPDQGISGSLSGGGRWNRFALETAFSARRFHNLTGGAQGGLQPLTGYGEGGLYLGAGADLGRGSLIFVYQGVRQYDGLRNERSQPNDLYSLPEVARDLTYARYDGDFEVRGRPVELSVTLYYQRQAETARRQQLLYDTMLHLQNHVDAFGLQAQARADLGRGGNLAAGIEGIFEWVDSLALRSSLHEGATAALTAAPGEARYPEGGRAQSLAVFLQDEVDLKRLFLGDESKTAGRLRALISARAGANFLHASADDRLQRLLGSLANAVIPERQQNTPTYGGSFHLRYEFYPGLAITTGGLLALRVPNLDDQTRLDFGRPALLLPQAAALRPESAYAAEVGIRSAYRRVDGAAYYAFTYLDNPLVVLPMSLGGLDCLSTQDGQNCNRFLTRANGPTAQLHSVEVNLRVYMFWGLSAFATVTYTYAKGEGGTPPIGRVPPVYGVAALEFSRPRTVFSFAQLIVRWAGPQRQVALEDKFDPTICLPSLPMDACRGTPGFVVLSLRSALRLSRQIYMTGVIDNITNDSYRFHGSGVDGPGVGVHVAVEANY